MKPDRIQPEDEVQGPAIITPMHVLRPAVDDDMRPMLGRDAYTKLTVFEKINLKGQLEGGSPKYTAKMRLDAGRAYVKTWDAAQESGRDSTQALNISHSTSPGGYSEARTTAVVRLGAIHSHLGYRDRKIIMRVLGEGCWPVDAIKEVCGTDYKHTIAGRFRESMDALIEATETARRHPNVIDMVRRP